MKKLYKVLTAAFVMGLVLTSPKMTITSHAFGFNEDAPEHNYGGDSDFNLSDPDSGSGSSDSGSSYSEPSSYDGGSSHESETSYDADSSYHSDSSYDNGSSDNGGSYTPSFKKNPNDVTMGCVERISYE